MIDECATVVSFKRTKRVAGSIIMLMLNFMAASSHPAF